MICRLIALDLDGTLLNSKKMISLRLFRHCKARNRQV